MELKEKDMAEQIEIISETLRFREKEIEDYKKVRFNSNGSGRKQKDCNNIINDSSEKDNNNNKLQGSVQDTSNEENNRIDAELKSLEIMLNQRVA